MLARLRSLSGLFIVFGLLGACAGQSGEPRPAASGSRVVRAYATYYGWYDNTPPGCSIAYRPYCAGGRGSYDDPITFASDPREFPVGTRLYYPSLEKYFVMADQCQECSADWSGRGPDGGPGLHHVDLWIGGRGAERAALECEDALTETKASGAPLLTSFIEDPPAGLPVSREPLFDPRTARCYRGAKAASSRGRLASDATGACLAASSPRAATRVVLASCSPGPSDEVVSVGPFLMVRGLCLGLAGGGAYGSPLVWAACDGGPRQQWELSRHGLIAWVQYLRCVGVRGSRVLLARCGSGRAVRWRFLPAR